MLSFPKRELSPQTQQSHKPQFPKSDIKHNIEHVNCRMRPVRIQRVLFYNNCPGPRINIVVLLHSRKSLVVVHQSCNLSTNINWISPNTLPDENDIPHFRHHYFHAEQPVVLRSAEFVRHSLPGYQKWFVAQEENGPVRLNYEYLSQFGDAVVPLEMTTTKASSSSSSSPKNRDDNEIQFQRINAPLSMFLEWMQLTSQRQLESPATATATAAFNKTQIYLAQAHISDLPSQLSQDFNPPPRLVTETGRNDIYATNLWIGSPPTYTPLHRDPNPNLFVHLSGLKRVRMLNPQNGMRVFMGVRSRVMENEEEDRRRRETTSSSSSSFIRGEEMMMGLERKLLEDSIWQQQQQQQHSEKSSLAESDSSKEMVGYDVLLERGDALFIPKGWWHSLKGVGEGITASVNWWFR